MQRSLNFADLSSWLPSAYGQRSNSNHRLRTKWLLALMALLAELLALPCLSKSRSGDHNASTAGSDFWKWAGRSNATINKNISYSAICVVANNENAYLREWLHYHKCLGELHTV